LIDPHVPPPPDGRAVLIPNGTKGTARDRKFLKDGKLVEPYAANTCKMLQDKAMEVEPFEVTEGPQRGVKGWVSISLLQRTAVPF
jgi:hypothetical protein